MPHQSNERSAGALIHLLKVCLRDAASSRETREALGVLQEWLAHEMEAMGSGEATSHGVLTPAARGRASATAPSDGEPLTGRLVVPGPWQSAALWGE